MKYLLSFTFVFFIVIFPGFSKDKYKEIKPSNSSVNYVGRFDFSQNDQVKFDWPGTYFRCRFTGSSIGLRLEGPKDAYFNVFVDNLPVKVISSSNEIIWVAQNLKSEVHMLQVYKRTEASIGMSVFKGLVVDPNADLLPWEKFPEHRIEFIGNSITCGYGNEGANCYDKFKPVTENNFYSYAPILSRAFGADYHIEAHSGLGIVRHYGDSLPVSITPQMPVKFKQTLDNDTMRWDFSRWKPDVLVINLGTNDFTTHPYPGKEIFIKTYEDLIKTVRKVYGAIPVFCLVGPMIDEPCFSYVKETTENIKVRLSDNNIYFIGIPPSLLNKEDDLGSDWHPSVKGQKKMAKFIAPVISNVLKWEYNDIK